MSPRVFLALLVITAFAIWIGDVVAQEYAAPGMERTFAVLVIAVAIVGPVAWAFERLGTHCDVYALDLSQMTPAAFKHALG